MKALLLCLSVFSMSVFAADHWPATNFCHGKTKVSYTLIDPDKNGKASDADLMVNGKTYRYMTAYSWFGAIQRPPEDFKFAILGEHEFNPLLVFDTYLQDANGKRYVHCK